MEFNMWKNRFTCNFIAVSLSNFLTMSLLFSGWKKSMGLDCWLAFQKTRKKLIWFEVFITKIEDVPCGSELGQNLLPHAGKPETDLMLTSHTVTANPLCTGCQTPNCTVAREEGQAAVLGVMPLPVWPLSHSSVWRGAHIFNSSSLAPRLSLRCWQIRECNFTDGEKAAEVSLYPNLFYLLGIEVWMWFQDCGGLTCSFFWSYFLFQCHWDK